MDLASVAAGCMTVELTVPRILAFAFIGLGLVGQVVVQARVQIRRRLVRGGKRFLASS